MFHAYIFQGYTDSVTTCDCCGRDGLKRTVALWAAEEGEEVYFGTSCAGHALGMSAKEVKVNADLAQRARDEAKAEALRLKNEAEAEAWRGWLAAKFTPVRFSNGDLDIMSTCRKAGLTVGAALKMRDAEMAA